MNSNKIISILMLLLSISVLTGCKEFAKEVGHTGKDLAQDVGDAGNSLVKSIEDAIDRNKDK